MRQCLMLDLRDEPALITDYEARHRVIWPEVAAHLAGQRLCRKIVVLDQIRRGGVLRTQLFRF